MAVWIRSVLRGSLFPATPRRCGAFAQCSLSRRHVACARTMSLERGSGLEFYAGLPDITLVFHSIHHTCLHVMNMGILFCAPRKNRCQMITLIFPSSEKSFRIVSVSTFLFLFTTARVRPGQSRCLHTTNIRLRFQHPSTSCLLRAICSVEATLACKKREHGSQWRRGFRKPFMHSFAALLNRHVVGPSFCSSRVLSRLLSFERRESDFVIQKNITII